MENDSITLLDVSKALFQILISAVIGTALFFGGRYIYLLNFVI